MFIFGVAKRLETYKNLFLLSGGAARGSPGSLAGKKKLLARQFKLLARQFQLLAQLFGQRRAPLPARRGTVLQSGPALFGAKRSILQPRVLKKAVQVFVIQ